MRKIFAAYLLLLTLLLLSRNPLGWFAQMQSARSMYSQLEPVAHLVSFALLTLLALASPWRITRLGMVGMLAVYGIATELVQSQIPGRSMQQIDLIQDLAGIVIGVGLDWTWRRWRVGHSRMLPASEHWQHPRRRTDLPPARPTPAEGLST